MPRKTYREVIAKLHVPRTATSTNTLEHLKSVIRASSHVTAKIALQALAKDLWPTEKGEFTFFSDVTTGGTAGQLREAAIAALLQDPTVVGLSQPDKDALILDLLPKPGTGHYGFRSDADLDAARDKYKPPAPPAPPPPALPTTVQINAHLKSVNDAVLAAAEDIKNIKSILKKLPPGMEETRIKLEEQLRLAGEAEVELLNNQREAKTQYADLNGLLKPAVINPTAVAAKMRELELSAKNAQAKALEVAGFMTQATALSKEHATLEQKKVRAKDVQNVAQKEYDANVHVSNLNRVGLGKLAPYLVWKDQGHRDADKNLSKFTLAVDVYKQEVATYNELQDIIEKQDIIIVEQTDIITDLKANPTADPDDISAAEQAKKEAQKIKAGAESNCASVVSAIETLVKNFETLTPTALKPSSADEFLMQRNSTLGFDDRVVKRANLPKEMLDPVNISKARTILAVAAGGVDNTPYFMRVPLEPDEVIVSVKKCNLGIVTIVQDKKSVRDMTPVGSDGTYNHISLLENKEIAMKEAIQLLSNYDKAKPDPKTGKKPPIRLSGRDTDQIDRIHAAVLYLKDAHPAFKDIVVITRGTGPEAGRFFGAKNKEFIEEKLGNEKQNTFMREAKSEVKQLRTAQQEKANATKDKKVEIKPDDLFQPKSPGA